MNPKVELHIKGQGVVTLELDEQKAPKTVANFLAYVKKGHYDGTIFHRVIDGFMIQGGGFAPGMKQKPTGATVENEASNGLKNDKYTVAMARTNDPHSASAQFFINVAKNDFLNHTAPSAQGWGYAVFGKVVAGTEIVDRLKGVKTGTRMGHGDVPNDDVVLEKAVVV
jgi:peptidyl-prolyl cis-trans isomerase B (cyclophilin B)